MQACPATLCMPIAGFRIQVSACKGRLSKKSSYLWAVSDQNHFNQHSYCTGSCSQRARSGVKIKGLCRSKNCSSKSVTSCKSPIGMGPRRDVRQYCSTGSTSWSRCCATHGTSTGSACLCWTVMRASYQTPHSSLQQVRSSHWVMLQLLWECTNLCML